MAIIYNQDKYSTISQRTCGHDCPLLVFDDISVNVANFSSNANDHPFNVSSDVSSEPFDNEHCSLNEPFGLNKFESPPPIPLPVIPSELNDKILVLFTIISVGDVDVVSSCISKCPNGVLIIFNFCRFAAAAADDDADFDKTFRLATEIVFGIILLAYDDDDLAIPRLFTEFEAKITDLPAVVVVVGDNDNDDDGGGGIFGCIIVLAADDDVVIFVISFSIDSSNALNRNVNASSIDTCLVSHAKNIPNAYFV
ncbi:hypothetical protein DERP_009951 [Dermatophagoides pteronyssinus]|uniref:Uncharacterized protein n=1 Tax=Dermatophagoides pteronyssinus TaxID=6956 RepID=A0ABQ8J212_DERPT|nr:hypothetical protein DERP_009951 [Dermatophagoides pteronyssinus]